MYKIKGILFLVVLAAIALQETESTAILVAKAKLHKLPLIAAKVKVAKEVKTKVAIAAVLKAKAIKAKAAAAASIITAPFKVAKTAAVIKLGAIKAAAALKKAAVIKAGGVIKAGLLAKKTSAVAAGSGAVGAVAAHAVHAAQTLAKPIAVNVNAYHHQPLVGGLGLGAIGGPLIAGVHNFDDGARSIVSTIGDAIQKTVNFGSVEPIPVSQPIYRVVHEQYNPIPVQRFALPAAPQTVETINVIEPHSTYGLPN